MLHAIAYPEPERGMHSELRGTTGNFDKTQLSRARLVLREAPDLVDLVLAGKSLDDAYREAQQRRNAAASEEKQLAQVRAEGKPGGTFENPRRSAIFTCFSFHGTVFAMTKILAAIAALDWTFAKTMPEQLHEYTLRKDNPDDFARLWQAVEEHGRPELWNGRRYRYLYPGDGWRYWVMPRYRFILNRARVADPQPPVRP